MKDNTRREKTHRKKLSIMSTLNMQKRHREIFFLKYGNIDYCQKCGDNIGLQVHHIDKNHTNNIPENLVKLCYKCHLEAHKGDKQYNIMKKRAELLYGGRF